MQLQAGETVCKTGAFGNLMQAAPSTDHAGCTLSMLGIYGGQMLVRSPSIGSYRGLFGVMTIRKHSALRHIEAEHRCGSCQAELTEASGLPGEGVLGLRCRSTWLRASGIYEVAVRKF